MSGVDEQPGGTPPGDEAAPEAPAPESSVEAFAVPPLATPMPPPRKHHVAPALVSLERVLEDSAFRLRDEGDVSALATDIARLGQLFPVDLRLRPPDRFEIISGFRRVAALRFLQREKVLARLHTDLSDEDAMLLALAEAVHVSAVPRAALEGALERLESEGRLTPTLRDMLEKALATEDPLAPEEVPDAAAAGEDDEGEEDAEGEDEEEEVDADELAGDATLRLAQLNQDLSLLADVFRELDPVRRRELLQQLRYSAQLVEFLEGRS